MVGPESTSDHGTNQSPLAPPPPPPRAATPGSSPATHWDVPSPASRPAKTAGRTRHYVAFVIGALCSLAVAAISLTYEQTLAAGESPSVSFVYGLRSAPFLLAGVPLLLYGADGVARPWHRGRTARRWVVALAAAGWYLVALAGPGLLV